ncbi:MAG: prepilin peptidase [Actinomycetota bacterium]|nr:prepilin peptidase [Actinomycetota bacterium]MDI6821399.1 prepilin peptidase [Actinomycetota bacterium]
MLKGIMGLVFFIFGLAIGSFLNVCIYRLPRKESIIFPSSHCPHCGRIIRAYDNIPLIGYLLLKGRCRYCKGRISIQYPLVELLTGLLFLFCFLKFGLSSGFLSASFFTSILLLVASIDLKHKIIPNKVILPALVVQFILVILSNPQAIGSSLIGFFIGGGLLLLVALLAHLFLRREGMGGGDIKLAAFLGIFLGWHVLTALFLGFLLGAISGIALIIFKGMSRKDIIPFGPFLALGGFITLFFGPQIFRYYLSLCFL